MDNKKWHIALKKMVHSIPKFKIKTQMPNLPQGPKLKKKRKILGHFELYFPKAIEARVRGYKYVETKLESLWKSF